MQDVIKYIDRKSGKIITENPPGEFFLKFLYFNPLGKLALNLIVKRKFLSAFYGFLMNQTFSTRFIADFIKNNNMDISDAIKKVEDFTTFNDFFCRKLKPSTRPIGKGVTSPADGKILVFDKISENRDFFIKGSKFTLGQFLQDDELVTKYKDGSMAIIRLAPSDYHRFHFPVSGKVTSSYKINGDYYSVSPLALNKSLEIFCENIREYSQINSTEFGEVIYSEVGATMVGSIIQTYKTKSIVKKGDEKGYFAFGGSSLVLLFEKGKIQFSDDLIKNTKNNYETAIFVGETIAVSTI